jgi:hypothetical protein
MTERLQQTGRPVRLRTRGSLERRVQTRCAENVRDGAEALVRAIRADLDGLPLCIASYIDDEHDAILAHSIMKSLTEDDTLWLIQANPRVDPLCVSGGSAFVLDLRNPVHAEASRHIVADALLLSSQSLTADLVEHWHDRTALAVVDCTADDVPANLLARFKGVSARIGKGLYRCQSGVPLLDSAVSRLTGFITDLQEDPQRRAVLAASLQPLQHQPAVLARLVRCLDKYEWPDWAVESLPASYLSLGTSGKHHRALLWSYLRDCFHPGQFNVVSSHAGGAIVEVEVTNSENDLGMRLNEYVTATLCVMPTAMPPNDRAFHGVLSHALRVFGEDYKAELADLASVKHLDLAKAA